MKVKSSQAKQASESQSQEKPEIPRRANSRAKRNADAYTAFVVLGSLSTGLFLAGSGLTIWSGLRYAKAAGSERLLGSVSQGSDRLFEESGQLSADARAASASIPGLYGMLQRIEERADENNQDVQAAIDEMRDEARQNRRKGRKALIGSAVAAGVGVVGMLVFLSAAKIARHRGLMLHRRNWALAPAVTHQELGLSLSLRW